MSHESPPTFRLRTVVIAAMISGGIGWYSGYTSGIEDCPAHQYRIRDREKAAMEYLQSVQNTPPASGAICGDEAGEEWRESLLDQECLDYCAQYYETPEPYPRSRTDF